MPSDIPQTTPKRIQRRRTKGWRMPPNTVYVGRPTRWGNPFLSAAEFREATSTFPVPQGWLRIWRSCGGRADMLIVIAGRVRPVLADLRGKNSRAGARSINRATPTCSWRSRMPDKKSPTLTTGRCLVTGNLCGTDTRPAGRPCRCENCVQYFHAFPQTTDLTGAPWAGGGDSCNKCDVNFPCWGNRSRCQRGFAGLQTTLRCGAMVFRKDTFRYTGGKRRFAMHYARGRCDRRAVENGLCRQHATMESQGRFVGRWHNAG